jgi:NADH-quinone oxidoreductase subunit M
MPRLAVFFMIITLSSIALPGTNGFVGEFLILLGAFRSNVVFGVLATSGVILGAVYMLWMFQRVMFGQITREENKGLKDLTKRETVILCAIVFFIFYMGLHSQAFFSKIDATATGYLQNMQAQIANHPAGPVPWR